MGPKTYTTLFFAQGEESLEYFAILEKDGERKTVKYLLDIIPWGASECETSEKAPWGMADWCWSTCTDENTLQEYVLNINYKVPYIGLTLVQHS